MVKKKTESVWKGILKEIKVEGDRVGFADKFSRTAVLNPRECIEKENQIRYDTTIHKLENQGYKIIYTSNERRKKLSQKRVYDILEGA